MSKIDPKDEKWLLTATIIASSMAFIDQSALNVALPAMQDAFDASATVLLWIVNGYALFLSSLLLVGGSLGDYFGRKKIFILGISIFAISSLICGLSQSPKVLIAFRCIQGIGAALLVPGSLSLLSALFSEEKRGGAIGTWSSFSSLTTVTGPIIGGYLASEGLWRYIFFINLPLSVLAIIILFWKIPENKDPGAKKLDIPGAVLASLGLGGITYGAIQSSERGFLAWDILSSIVLGIIVLLFFFRRQRVIAYPMMDLKLFRNKLFSVVNVQTFLIYGALSAGLFFIPLNLVQIQGYNELQAGTAMLPFALTIAGLSPLAGKYAAKWDPKWFLTLGPLVSGIAFFWLSYTHRTAGFGEYWNSFFPPFLALGIGMGLTVAPLTNTVMSEAGEKNSGVASGINNTISRAAGVLAIAVIGSIVINIFQHKMVEEAQQMELTPAQTEQLRSNATDLARTEPPQALGEGKKERIKQKVDQNFLHVFDIAARIASALCVAGAIAGFIFIDRGS